jgi:hypothetical protein
LSYIGAKPTIAEYYYDAFSGNGVRDTFTCTIEPASPVSAIVVVGGSVISPEDYYFDGTFIKFATPPSAGTNNIQIRYLAVPASGIAAPKTFRQVSEYYAAAGQTNFSVQRYDLGYVDVYVNGVQLGNLDYQASDGENIVLQVPARENDFVRIVTAYNTLLARQVINATPGSVLVGNGVNPLIEVPLGAANTLLMSTGNNWISQSTIFNYDGIVRGNIIPDTANTYYLGSVTHPFHSIHVGPGSVYIGNTVLNTSNAELLVENAGLRISDLNITGNGTIAGNLYVVGTTEFSNLEVSGNLFVRGTTTEIQTTSVSANDTLIYLGSDNFYSDTHDIGFVSHYYNGAQNTHTGLIRSSSSKEYYLFGRYDDDVNSNNIINISAASFSAANLNANFIKANLIGTSVSVSGPASAANLTVSGTASAPYINNATSFTGSSMRVDYLGVGVGAGGITGEIRAANDVVAFYTSDMRNKENIKDIEDSLNKVIKIGGKTFDWKDSYINQRGGEDDYFVRKSDFGVIGQDVEKVFPLAVHKKIDGTLAVDYVKLVALAFAAIAELKSEIDALKGK